MKGTPKAMPMASNARYLDKARECERLAKDATTNPEARARHESEAGVFDYPRRALRSSEPVEHRRRLVERCLCVLFLGCGAAGDAT